MAAALTLLLIGCLLQGALCGQYMVTMPQNIEVLSGSCVTIPCSFDISDDLKYSLDGTCSIVWKKYQNTVVFNSRYPQLAIIKGKLTGNVGEKDCTVTLNNMQPQDSNRYFPRLECLNSLKYDFVMGNVNISVRGVPPTPTLSPTTLAVRAGTSVSVNCSAPVPCPSHPPALTWTPSLGDTQETLQEIQDKTKVKTSVLTFAASHLHHRQEISCTAVYKKQDDTELASSSSLVLNILTAPQILSSSDCTKAGAQLSCSCETVGNPSPTSQWYLDGSPVNHSDKFAISNEPLNGTGLRIVITVNQLQWRNLSTLLCNSSNSLGSATQRFYVYSLEPRTSAEHHDLLTLTVFITTVVALLVLVCALLLVIRAQKRHHELPKNTVAMSQFLTSGEGSELQVSNTTEEDIYVNSNAPRPADVAHPAITLPNGSPSYGPNNVEGADKSSEKKNEEDGDVIYSNVDWKRKGKKEKGEDAVDLDQPGSSYLEEERCMVGEMCRNIGSNALEEERLYDDVGPRNVNKEVECEYAQVKFKNKNAMHK